MAADKCFNEKVKCLNEESKEVAAPLPTRSGTFPAKQYDRVIEAFSVELQKLGGETYISNIGRDRKELKRLFSQGISVAKILCSDPCLFDAWKRSGLQTTGARVLG